VDLDEFDFGKAKLDFFKRQAKDALVIEEDIEYDVPLDLNNAYKQLKNAIKNAPIVHSKRPDFNYQRSTFAVERHNIKNQKEEEKFLTLMKYTSK
jgi:hypothetical protein